MNETSYKTYGSRSSRIRKHPEICLTMAGTGKSTGGEPGNPLPCTHCINHT